MAAGLADEVLLRLVPALLGIEQDAVEIEDDRVRHRPQRPRAGRARGCISSKRSVGRRRVAKNEARTISAANRNAVFSALSWASS